ncbi:MAG TPA: FadR/GntR family transcriptional regulator [Chloroflexota bacterium]|nr:FadR/GntR family transcriptional regulator [Chloroflexota bacterium]
MEQGTWEKVERTNSYEAIVEQVRHMIDSGVVRPGDRLPAERELAGKLAVSRATLREAFRVLEHTGLVESKIGQGRFVAQIKPYGAVTSGTARSLEGVAILDFLEVRRSLEVGMAGLAAERASAEEIANMEASLYKVPENEEVDLKADTGFHMTIAEATHNGVYKRFFSSELFLLYRLATTIRLGWEWRNYNNPEHRDVLEAIRCHDRPAAEAAMLHHISSMENRLRFVLSHPAAQR